MMMSPMSATASTFAHHKRTNSHPPPYHGYSAPLKLEEDVISPHTGLAPHNPYLSSSNLPSPSASASSPPGYAMLPAFDKPRRYSERLHRLMQTRDKPLLLNLNGEEGAQPYQIIYLDEKIGYHDDDDQRDTSYLLPGMLIDEEKQDYTHHRRSRRNRRLPSSDNEFEMSWLAFCGFAAALFITVCACSMFVAWTAGFFGDISLGDVDPSGTIHTTKPPAVVDIATNTWNDNYRMISSEGYLIAEDVKEDISSEERQAIAQLDLPPRWATVKGAAARRKAVENKKKKNKRTAVDLLTDTITM